MAERPLKRKSPGGCNYVHDYTIDVITTGSEATEPTLFLSVSRKSKSKDVSLVGSETDAKLLEPAPAIARYAMLGISDLMSRLVADQKYSWASTKAVFTHNNHLSQTTTTHNNKNNVASRFLRNSSGGTWGIPALLMALHQAGAAELTVVAGNERDAVKTENLVKLLDPRGVYPCLRIASVPGDAEDDKTKWWTMYQDEYLVVHATCPQGRPDHLIYLFTCLRHTTVPNYTIAVLPNPSSWYRFLDLWRLPEDRVVLGSKRVSVEMLVAVSDETDASDQKKFYTSVRSILPESLILFCCPKEKDEGILLRASKFIEPWHYLFPRNIIWHRPTNNPADDVSVRPPEECEHRQEDGVAQLSSFSSVACDTSIRVCDRMHAVLQYIRQAETSSADINSIRAFLEPSIVTGNSTPASPSHLQDGQDANEIDIDDSSDDEETQSVKGDDGQDSNEIDIDDTSGDDETRAVKDDVNKITSTKDDNESDKDESTENTSRKHNKELIDTPQLLVLGTGCAAPSPLRGASAYGCCFLKYNRMICRPRNS